MAFYVLGLDIGSSSVKAALVEAETGKLIASANSPETEMQMQTPQPGWAEQSPELWWEHARKSFQKCAMLSGIHPREIKAIGIAYQMHGLVLVNKEQKALRPSIIWCDSRAVTVGEKAFDALGHDYSLQNLLNSPGNFTASKLRWVQENEPAIYEQIEKAMLPGDFIAMKLTGEIVTTDTGLSEGVFWNYKSNSIDERLLAYFSFDKELLPSVLPVFSVQGRVGASVANEWGLTAGIPVSYRGGDQPNNALSLNVMNPGETAATGGTSGVIYSVTDTNAFDVKSRVNTFVHVNNSALQKRNGVLLCVNGTGILNSWIKRLLSTGSLIEYDALNAMAATAPIGSEGLMVLPFGNGAERILENRNIGAHSNAIDFNRHTPSHIVRAAQEGIVFALRYGFDILKEMRLPLTVIRAGHANLFLSPVFREAFTNTMNVPLELYAADGARGAAMGAAIGVGFMPWTDAGRGLTQQSTEQPDSTKNNAYQDAYQRWRNSLNVALKNQSL